MHAKDLATLAGTTVRTIRYYHHLGLLAVPEPGTSWRSYGFAHLTRLMRIRWLVDSGVPLAEVPHLLRPPGTADERTVVVEDLDAVLASIDEKLTVLTAQRARVATLLERVNTEGRLSPLPASVVRLYDRLLERQLSPALLEAMRKERDLLELACYRGAVPSDVVTLVDAMDEDDLDRVCDLWEECQRLDAQQDGPQNDAERKQILDLARRTVDLARAVEPAATRRLLARAVELNRPAVRAALDLAYPSPVYRQFVAAFVSVASERTPT